MPPINQKIKDVTELTIDDFAQHPVWKWFDEDDDTVIPEDCVKVLPDDVSDALFIGCKLYLHDGTQIAGALSVVAVRQWVYVVKFAQADGTFFLFPLQPQLEGLVTREQLATQMNKSVDQIFPLIYKTPYVFSNGQPLSGQID